MIYINKNELLFYITNKMNRINNIFFTLIALCATYFILKFLYTKDKMSFFIKEFITIFLTYMLYKTFTNKKVSDFIFNTLILPLAINYINIKNKYFTSKKEDTLYIKDDLMFADVYIDDIKYTIPIHHHKIEGTKEITTEDIHNCVFTDGKIKNSDYDSTYLLIHNHNRDIKIEIHDPSFGGSCSRVFKSDEKIIFD